ncbi:MAG TPA: ABC transporter permease [Actinomycetota bacterium]|nr:ABC transporter permease [Actinomycetota bacterium]
MILANLLTDAFFWIRHPESSLIGSDISERVVEHLEMTGLALAFALVPSLAAGLAIGHTRRAEFITISLANLGRAIPSLAILAFVFPITLELGLGLSNWPAIITVSVLAVPPILTNAYVGVREVDPDVLEAARGMGMSGSQILLKVEIPLATPLIVAGVRTAAVQVVATATLAALVAGGGLGRFIIDGFATQEHQVVLGGAILVALLAIATELGFSVLEKLVSTAQARRKTSFAPAYTDISQAPRAPEIGA